MRRAAWQSCARNADVPRMVPTKATAVNAKETVVMAVLMRKFRTASVSLLSKRGSWTSLKSLSNVSDTSVASQKKDVKCSARNALHNVEQRSVHAARCPCSGTAVSKGIPLARLFGPHGDTIGCRCTDLRLRPKTAMKAWFMLTAYHTTMHHTPMAIKKTQRHTALEETATHLLAMRSGGATPRDLMCHERWSY